MNNLINSNKGRLIHDVNFRIKALVIELIHQGLNKSQIKQILTIDGYDVNVLAKELDKVN